MTDQTATDPPPAEPSAPSWPDSLTEREVEVAEMLARGFRTTEIATVLSISVKTVDTHRGHALAKLGLRCAVALSRWAIRRGLVSLDEAADAPGCTQRGGRPW